MKGTVWASHILITCIIYSTYINPYIYIFIYHCPFIINPINIYIYIYIYIYIANRDGSQQIFERLDEKIKSFGKSPPFDPAMYIYIYIYACLRCIYLCSHVFKLFHSLTLYYICQ